MSNNFYNVDEADVQEVEEFSEPVEEVEATVMKDFSDFDVPTNINGKGKSYAIFALIFGGISCLSLLWLDFSFVLCLVSSALGGYFSGKYLFEGYHHKVFGKLALAGFLLSLAGLGFGTIKIVLISITSLGQAFLKALF